MSEAFDQLQAYVSDIKKIVNNFSIRGMGVSGHITTGYIVNAGVGTAISGESTGGGTLPPSSKVLAITFSGVGVCSGCLTTADYPYIAPLGNPFTVFAAGIINDTPSTISQTSTNVWDAENVFGFGISVFNDATDCSGAPTATTSMSIDIHVGYSGGTWTVVAPCHLAGQPRGAFFEGTVVAPNTGGVVTNALGCGSNTSYGALATPFYIGISSKSLGSGGTATITLS